VDDRSKILLSACLGAVVGGVAGYLFLTGEGRRVRERLEPGMDNILRELRGLRSAADKARMAVDEGLEAVEDLRRGVASPQASPGWAGRPPQVY
jgi:hypothetical protein